MSGLSESLEKFRVLMNEQLDRIETIKKDSDWVDYTSKESIVVGVCWGDGIGESISNQAQRVLEFVLKEAVDQGRVSLKIIDGLTIENRIKALKAIPDDVLEELKTFAHGSTSQFDQGCALNTHISAFWLQTAALACRTRYLP